ncbi:alpha-2-macroglobulin family protein [Psychroserpens algicola]|uniref:MG2 domain-containing protein n=1 Tax=Psychroserpens algicola TaxID=1719034 RepID=A0ABT0H6Q8_9FLAO|nr:MG2 domain-containing protein [Psychroserpens algicola]MCK8480058.1 MG2 domain-containing protein [Psychroserpens algicola]
MKPFISLLMIFCFAHFTNAQTPQEYSELWKQVNDFENQGLPKSALKIVESIAEKAKTSQNTPQEIKSLLFKSKYALILEEEAQFSVIQDFKDAISKSKTPTKNVLQNILATLYWQYFNQNKWKFYNRTKTSEKVDTNDFRTWDLQTLFDEVHTHYEQSLANGLILQQTDLKAFDAILIEQVDSKIYRPTLFDLLSHNALQFYKTEENNITRPAYKFEIENSNLLSPSNKFANIKLVSKDSSSLQLQALKIYQNLIKFHLKDNSPKALVDVNIERLNYVYEHAVFDNKEEFLLNALQEERKKWHTAKLDVTALYDFEIAKLFHQQGQNYHNKTNPNNRWKLKDALAVCNSAINSYPKSKGAEKCSILKTQILSQTLQITTEELVPINTNSLALISYKNTAAIDFKIGTVSEADLKILRTYNQSSDQLKILKEMKPIERWTSNLKDEKDYQLHNTEIAIPKLKNGRYVIFGEVKNDSDAYAFKEIQVTDIAYIQKENEGNITYQVVNRQNGKPLKGANITLSYVKNYQGKRITENYTSNDSGEFFVSQVRYNRTDAKLIINISNDQAQYDDLYLNRYYNYGNNTPNYPVYKAFLFTDRSIYRPGQPVYFKGIVMTTKKDKSEVLSDKPVTVTLYNTNNEKVKTLELKTNDFGSVAGEFILPNNGLTGHFSIRLKGSNNINAYHSISVEEYKRPKFEATFNPVSDTYKVNDTVTVKGHALAYAGSHITDAKVVYRVHRKVQYPRWYYWYRPYFNTEPQEITHGETITDAEGNFEVNFKAIPDTSVDRSSLPTFNYEISADITDINGETRSATTTVYVGYHALTASIGVAPTLDKDEKTHQITIDTKNLNGEPVDAKGTIKIYKLKSPNTVLRSRPWEAPDYQVFSETEFKSLFPHEAYSDEDKSSNWDKGEMVFSKDFDTGESKTIALGKIKRWTSGKYVILLETEDRFGQAVKDEIQTTLYSRTDEHLADNALFSATTNKNEYKSGDTAELTLASSATDLYVTVEIEKASKIISKQIVILNNNKKTIRIPVETKDLGGFVVHYTYAFKNTFKQGSMPIVVPYPKTDLDIETMTFRDKLQPGTDETWRFKIKGPQGDKVSAELLASMYDASLDQFKSHDWYFTPIQQPHYYSRYRLNAGKSFRVNNFRVENLNYGHRNYTVQYYDQLDFFGLYFSDYYYGRQQYLRQQQVIPSTYTSKNLSSVKKGYIEGIITDNQGLALPGANVVIKGTETGVVTDFDGKFSLKAKKGQVLHISYLGFSDLDIKISEDNYFTITMNESVELEEVVVAAYAVSEPKMKRSAAVSLASEDAEMDMDAVGNAESLVAGGSNTSESEESSSQDMTQKFNEVVIRKNLQETAFFFPQLLTDSEGQVSFSFTTPEALTKWKLQLLAHTKSLESATTTLEMVTQKELMVLPNAPRFLREGDQITISTKIANLTDNSLSGQAVLILSDAISGDDITEQLLGRRNMNYDAIQHLQVKDFSVDAKGNTQASWTLNIPFDVDAVQYKIIAKSGTYSDGEQSALPVLSNRMLVTETLPMWIRSNESKTFKLDKLASNNSTTLKHHKLTLEMTSNPAWYAVQALPYLMEYPYECNEQTFSRYYANALASHIANSNPRIQEVFNQWRNSDALLSNLEKNQELKSILIQETPWLRDAQSETEQKKRIALLFDLNKMNNELESAKRKLINGQMTNGAWPWFNGGRPNRYITQHIITGFGHLKQLKVNTNNEEASMIKKAIQYLDDEFVQEYKNIRKYNADADLSLDHLSYTQLHYLYMRSFFPQINKSKEVQEITDYYQTQIQKYWLNRTLYAKGLMALVLNRMDDKSTAAKLLESLRENSITSEELGMYWKENTNSWYWYQAPIETQALLIEAFSEIENDITTVDNLKIWLLKHKQTNRWSTTKATTDAVYALLLQGSDWLSVTEMVDIVLGGKHIEPSDLEDVKVEAGTGYFKTSWNTAEIKPEMATVELTKKGNGIAWGALYWQYFEDLDKITSAETPLKLKKKLFKKTNTDTGEEMTEITAETQLNVGDLVRVRIELRSDRAMEFIHMKDMRAAGLEPVNVLSRYKYQDGLGYYESTKDASTNFFFDHLPKGVYVFEYDLRVNNAGHMSNGITTIQSMYAPEFSSHSEGTSITVESK